MKKSSLASLAVVVCTVAGLVASSFASDNPNTYKLTDAKTKKTVTLESMKGKYKAIYIDFFAQWCGPCQLEIAEVKRLNSMYGSKGVAFLGFDVWDKWNAMQQDIKARAIPYQVLFDPAPNPKGIAGMYEKGLNISDMSIPLVIILDGKTLKIKGHWEGYVNDGKSTGQQLAILKSLGVKV